MADENLLSWIYWQFKGYHDITTQTSVAEGLWFENGTLNTDKVKMLSRTYAQVGKLQVQQMMGIIQHKYQAVAGVYDHQEFDPDTSDFQLVYHANIDIQQPTIIFLNEKLYYPNGYNIRYDNSTNNTSY